MIMCLMVLVGMCWMSGDVYAKGGKKVDKQVVVFYVDLHCQGCCDKVMKNIAFEKGVKDLVCDLETKTVTVTYDANKTDVPTLQKAFAKIGKPATTTSVSGATSVGNTQGGSTTSSATTHGSGEKSVGNTSRVDATSSATKSASGEKSVGNTSGVDGTSSATKSASGGENGKKVEKETKNGGR